MNHDRKPMPRTRRRRTVRRYLCAREPMRRLRELRADDAAPRPTDRPYLDDLHDD